MPVKKPEPCPQRRQLGKNIAALRAKMELTQEKMAESVGVSARYFQSVEAGDYWPSLPTLSRIKNVLKCSWDDLLEGCDKV